MQLIWKPQGPTGQTADGDNGAHYVIVRVDIPDNPMVQFYRDIYHYTLQALWFGTSWRDGYSSPPAGTTPPIEDLEVPGTFLTLEQAQKEAQSIEDSMAQ